MKSKLPEGWNKVKLKEISKDNSGMYGINASGVDYDSNLYRYLRITDIKDDGTIDQSKKVSVEIKKGDDSKYLLNKNDVVLARTGASAGRSYFYDGTESPMIFAGFLIKFALDDSKVNPEYIKYYFQSREYKEWVKSVSTGSTRPNINAKMYNNMDIILPSFEQQQLLVDTLSALDNKIEMNNRVNENLEQQAQEIFKHWFVDFDFPDENGMPYKSSGGEMVESELGMIPKGWEVKLIKDYAEVKSGYAFKSSWWSEEGTKVLKITNISSGKLILDGCSYVEEERIPEDDRYIAYPSDLLIALTGATLGKMAIIPKLDETLLVNQRVGKFIYKDDYDYPLPFLYCLLMSESIRKEIVDRGHGSAQPNISPTNLESIEFVYPPKYLVEKFNKNFKPFFEYYTYSYKQNQKLSNLRDTLLPKLMSGELRIPLDE